MIGKLIYIIGMGSMAITGALYLAYILYQLIKQLRQTRYTRLRFEPTEQEDYIDGQANR